jgi:hypothetical protein
VRRRRLARLLPLLCAVAVLGAGACGTTTSLSPSRTTATPTPADSPTPTPTPNPDAAIISAYEQAETTYIDLEEIPEDDAAALAELKDWFVNPAYTSHAQQLEVYVANGERETGSVQDVGTPTVTSVQGTSATIHECGYTTLATVNAATGQDVNVPAFGYVLLTATLVDQSGGWVVSTDGGQWEGTQGCSTATASP